MIMQGGEDIQYEITKGLTSFKDVDQGGLMLFYVELLIVKTGRVS